MAYSIEFSRAISIGLFIHLKTEHFKFEYVPTKVISEYLKIPAPTVVRILKSLNASGITMSKEGVKGGVILAKPITEILLLDIFQAIEKGSLFKIELDYLIDNSQINHVRSIITDRLLDAENAMKESLKKTTLSDILLGANKG